MPKLLLHGGVSLLTGIAHFTVSRGGGGGGGGAYTRDITYAGI